MLKEVDNKKKEHAGKVKAIDSAALPLPPPSVMELLQQPTQEKCQGIEAISSKREAVPVSGELPGLLEDHDDLMLDEPGPLKDQDLDQANCTPRLPLSGGRMEQAQTQARTQAERTIPLELEEFWLEKLYA
ncbi:hypothetical protein NDU88_002202 [Pleurodeles waltl]|uniref:Uncharacterized protein n=1 Tax=Pleurodeles waltl TaxID=8319 RepID=A0AAV7LDK6_PLEWA|nr:hypothetical protein NDU88_002202 [Pleurodeles waltl]